ncbi:hypothetical protein HYE59_11120 [Aggregatibacter actinomycetemcomitans]|uniref:hypothetical protein n=1 Tax=Aggregatibacter actinomycetemcomitans TaxID=714 RepID=UPI00197C933A|nr:hypothetical protein [Aggregatibacter actinomycetemcomitans]MBN6078054.1 hypothetical protein [Aggregatibacter actinomycetemcomitans]
MKKLLLSLLIFPVTIFATETGESCLKLSDKDQRLACYDSIFLTVKQTEEQKEQRKSEWGYSQKKDEMRDEIGYQAKNTSKNAVDFGFPYSESKLNLILRKDPKYGDDIMFIIQRGQFSSCFDGCELIIKFDDQKIEHYSMVGAEGGSSDVLFISGKKNMQQFMDKLRKSKKMIVEASFFDHGKEQFTFYVSGLDWKHF